VRRGKELLRQLRAGEEPSLERELDDTAIDVIHAACCVIADGARESGETLLEDAEGLHRFISHAKWPRPDFDERDEALYSCAFAAWRSARQAKAPGIAADWFKRISNLLSTTMSSGFQLDQIPLVDAPVTPRDEVELGRPETLLKICVLLRERFDSVPLSVVDHASAAYRFIDGRKVVGRFDEREFFLGELALIAGVACRHLSRRKEARAWNDRAEVAFGGTVNAVVDLLRVGYQRLALRLEERQSDLVLEFAPALGMSLMRAEMREEALKCRFLEVTARGESGDLSGAVEVAEDVCHEAKELGNQRLLGLAYENLAHFAALLGDSSKTQAALKTAIPMLARLNDRIGLVKAQWAMGNLLRKQGKTDAAIETFCACRQAFQTLGMSADVAAMHLAVADLLLESGQDHKAMQEILSALSIIEELKMIPERLAAVSLLRESLRQQKINRQALRDLHGYFEDIQK
jgi:tetratricopeptide (TPR) repeat protein